VNGIPAPGTASSSTDTQLQKVVVEAIPQSANTLPTRPADSVYGLDDSVLDTPRSVYQVQQDQLINAPLNQVSDLARFAPSVGNASGQGIGGAPYIRGYTAEVYQDGFRVGRFLRPFDPNTAYDSLDIVTGPASVIYGPSSKTSGYLDWTTKQPFFDKNQTTVNLQFGSLTGGGTSFANFYQMIDNSGPITADKDLAYRLVYKQNEESSYYTGGRSDFEHLYSALAWLPTKDISVNWSFEYGNYDYALLRGWNRVTQSLIDNGTYDAGVATPVLKDTSGHYYEPVANNPNGPFAGFIQVTPTKNGTPTVNQYVPGGAYTPVGAGTVQGFVLRPGNTTQQTIYPYQGAVNPSDPINLNQYIAEQNAVFTIDSQTTLVNKSFFERDFYQQQTYDAASLQGTESNRFENRTEFRESDDFKLFGLNVDHKSNSGLDLNFLNETVNFNNSNFLLNAYDISGNQLTNMNINNLYGLLSAFPPGTTSGVVTTKAYGTIKLTPIYTINGLPYPLGGVQGSANYTSTVNQIGLYTFHEFTFDKQWTWDLGLRGTATYVSDTNPVLTPVGGTGYGTHLGDSVWAIEPVFTTSLSYKPVDWTTLYATYNYTQAINDDSGNSGGGVAYNNNGTIGSAALHSRSVLYESGAKFELIPNKLFATIAGYYQERALSPVIIPGSNPVYPEVHSHGFESQLNYQPNKNFSAGLNFSWMQANYQNYNPNASFSSPYGVVADGETVLSATAGSPTTTAYPLGNYAVSLPHDRVDAWASYQFDFGLGFTADLWATSEFNITNNYATIPAEYNLDLGIFFAQPRWRAQVDFLNVTDQTNFEIANSDAGENLLPSQPFSVQAKFSYTF
jgi:hypothetical protein